jgi:hypothetical protein
MAITQRTSQKQITQFLPLVVQAHAQPCQNCNRQSAARQFSCEFGRKVTEINLPSCQSVKPGDPAILIKETPRGRKSLVLVLQRFGVKPVIDLTLAAIKRSTRLTALQRFE